MATITSTQSGNFNNTSTWVGGVVPVDGDIFIVNYGHIVTVDDDRRVTNGYQDSYVRGKLHITGTGKLRMNGILYVNNSANYTQHFVEGQNSGGFFRMDPGSLLEIRGSNAEQHRLDVQGNGYVTCEVMGTNPNPKTTLSADVNNNETSLSFTDASDFAIGDWITIYKSERAGKDWQYYKSDEAFWIHDIDVNTVYFRKFVGPSASIVGVSDTLLVDDASVFRVGYKIIFGVGANRNVSTISDIDYLNNKITLSDSVIGNVVGETIYQTGTDKGHLNGDDVLRIAATLVEDSNVGDNTIKVNNVNGFNVGDLILIPANDPVYSNATSWDRIMDYTISAIDSSTNTITFTSGFTNTSQTTLQSNAKVGVGGIVINMARDTKITAPEGTTYGQDQASCVSVRYFNIGNQNYRRRFKFKNCELHLGSNTNSPDYRIIGIRGHNSFSLLNHGEYVCEFDGVTIHPIRRNTWNMQYVWEQHQLNMRNCVSYNANGPVFYTYGNNRGFYNNIGVRSNGNAWNSAGFYNDINEWSYNYGIRNNGGSSYDQSVEAKSIVSYNYVVFSTGRVCYHSYSANPFVFYRQYFNYYIVHPSAERVGRAIFMDSYLGNDWDVTGDGSAYSDSINMDSRSHYSLERTSAHSILFSSVCNNFTYNGFREWNRRALRFWDETSNSWRVYPDRDDSLWMGFDNHVFVPANTTVYIIGSVKTVSGNTNYPYIRASHIKNYYNGRYYNNADSELDISDSKVNFNTGWVKTDRFTSASVSDFETKTMTLDPLPFDTFMSISVSCNGSGSNSRLGWYEKDLKIVLTNPSPFMASSQMLHNLTTKIPVVVQQTPNQFKTILGG